MLDRLSKSSPTAQPLFDCGFFLRNDLQLNADKSEVVIIGTAPQLRSAANIREVEVAGSSFEKAEVIRRNDRLAPAIRLSRQGGS